MHIPERICANITYDCSKHCRFCDRLLDAFRMPDTNVTLEQCEILVKQIRDNATWLRQFKIAGGEATEHPKFLDVVSALTPVAQIADRCWVSTSYYRHEVPDLPRPWKYRIDPSEEGKSHHRPFMLSPKDMGLSSRKTCRFPWACGVCWDYQGWSFCPVGTQIARVFDEDIFHDEPVPARNEKSICQHCVYWLPKTVTELLQDGAIQGKLPLPSPTFSKYLHKHRRERKLHQIESSNQSTPLSDVPLNAEQRKEWRRQQYRIKRRRQRQRWLRLHRSAS